MPHLSCWVVAPAYLVDFQIGEGEAECVLFGEVGVVGVEIWVKGRTAGVGEEISALVATCGSHVNNKFK